MQRISRISPATGQSKPIFFIADFPPPINGNNIVTDSLFRFFVTQPGISLKKINTSVNTKKMFKMQRLYIFTKAGIRVLFLPRGSQIYLGLAHRLALVGQSIVIISGLIRGCNVVVHHHSYFPIEKKENLPLYVRLIHKYIVHNCTNVFLSDKMRMDYLEHWGAPINSMILSNSLVPAMRFNGPAPCTHTEHFTLIHVSNLSKEKGSHLVLDVMEYFLSENEKCNAILMGGDSHSQFTEKIQQLQSSFPSQFSYQAAFDANMLYENLKNSDVLLFPSTYENEASPLVVHEAQYCGVICVTSVAGTLISEVLQPGVASVEFLYFANLVSKVEELAAFKSLSPEEYYRDREIMRLNAIDRGSISIMTATSLFLEYLKS
jgi:glycosyltransferase involved in cell wall biosynthesis